MLSNPYDLLPYKSRTFDVTHPNCIGAIARLAGIAAAAPSHARVLELGCASGGNLIPMAVQFPGGRYVGVDFSAVQIDAGRSLVDSLRLSNIELRHASVIDVGPDWGEFDYIIAHGIFSWVPDDVKQGILRVCRQNLARNGVAYVSYNTLPGWHLKRIAREMMMHHVRGVGDLRDQVARARELMRFVALNAAGGESGNPSPNASAYGAALAGLTAGLVEHGEDYLAHEYLEGHNDPMYFSQFLERCQAAGLRYVGESPPGLMMADGFLASGPLAKLRHLAADPLDAQQYLDFLAGTTFRKSLLTHEESAVAWTAFGTVPDGVPLSGRFTEFPGEQAGEIAFESQTGTMLRNLAPPVASAVRHLTAIWPQSCTLGELLTVAGYGDSASQPQGPSVPEFVLRMMLGQLTLGSGVQVTIAPWPCVSIPGEHPVTTPLARWQSARGLTLTTQVHRRAKLDDRSSRVLALCDGTRTRERIAQDFVASIVESSGVLQWKGEDIADPQRLWQVAAECVAQTLAELAGHALFVA